MAITGIDTIDGKQIIAAGASSAVKAAQDGNGNNIASTYQTTADMSNYATTADITGKQDALTFNYNESDLITGINSSGIATGGGSTYSAGTGIDITDDVISVNSEYVPYLTITNNANTSEVTYGDLEALCNGTKMFNLRYGNLIYYVARATRVASHCELIFSTPNTNTEYENYNEDLVYTKIKYSITIYFFPDDVTDSTVAYINGNNIKRVWLNIQPNWNETNTLSETYIQNKPSIPTVQLNEDNEVSAINNYPLAGGGSLPASADEACQVVTANSADWNEVSAKADSDALQNYVPRSGLTDDNLSAQLDYYGLHLSSKYNNNASSYANYGTFGIITYIRSADITNYAAELDLAQTGLYMYQSSAYGSGGSGRASLNHNYLNLESVNGKAYISVNDYDLLNIYQSGNNQSPSFISFNRGNGLSYSAQNGYIGQFYTQISSDMNVPRYNPVWIVKNGSGDGFSIGASEAKGFDKDGNTIWSTKMSKAAQLINGSNDPKPAILLTPMPASPANSAQWTAAPYVSADYNSLSISYGPTASVPSIKIMPDDITTQILTSNSARARFGLNVGGVKFETSAGTWTLTGSVQKREFEGDSAVSSISAIAGSALTCELPADLVYTATLSATSALLNDDIQTVSAAIPVLSSLNTEGITDIQLVNELPVDPVSTVLYLIPEA